MMGVVKQTTLDCPRLGECDLEKELMEASYSKKADMPIPVPSCNPRDVLPVCQGCWTPKQAASFNELQRRMSNVAGHRSQIISLRDAMSYVRLMKLELRSYDRTRASPRRISGSRRRWTEILRIWKELQAVFCVDKEPDEHFEVEPLFRMAEELLGVPTTLMVEIIDLRLPLDLFEVHSLYWGAVDKSAEKQRQERQARLSVGAIRRESLDSLEKDDRSPRSKCRAHRRESRIYNGKIVSIF